MTDTTDRDTNHEEWLRFRRMIADDYMRGLRNNEFPLSLAAEVIDDPGGPDLRDLDRAPMSHDTTWTSPSCSSRSEP